MLFEDFKKSDIQFKHILENKNVFVSVSECSSFRFYSILRHLIFIFLESVY